MKRNLYSIGALLLILIPGIIFAQAKPQGPSVNAAPVAQLKAEPLSVRKLAIETQLRDIYARLSSVYTRTTVAVERLGENDIDIKKTQEQLLIANTALTNAKLAIDAFAAIQVNDEEKDKVKVAATTASLKDAVMKSEAALKDARVALIQSLSNLKAAIVISVQDTEY
jgi:uncharacterized membrane protein